jgi:hypothetical protein
VGIRRAWLTRGKRPLHALRPGAHRVRREPLPERDTAPVRRAGHASVREEDTVPYGREVHDCRYVALVPVRPDEPLDDILKSSLYPYNAKPPTSTLTRADIAHWGWIAAAGWCGVDIDHFPALKAWEERMVPSPLQAIPPQPTQTRILTLPGRPPRRRKRPPRPRAAHHQGAPQGQRSRREARRRVARMGAEGHERGCGEAAKVSNVAAALSPVLSLSIWTPHHLYTHACSIAGVR